MTRPHRRSEPRKTHTITFRLPPDLHAQLTATAANAGMTLTDVILARLQSTRAKAGTGGGAKRAENPIPPLPPALFAELRRIGNNVNQIAHAVNAGLPPELRNAYAQAARLIEILTADELLARRLALRTRTDAHDTAPSQTGIELQGGVRLYSARSGQDDR